MKRYEGQSDEELLQRMQQGETEVAEYLVKKYKYLVLRQARAMYLVGGDTDDLIQEGMLGLFKAVQGYRPEKAASFATFAQICIHRQIYSAVQSAGRQKHEPLNTYVSFSNQDWEGAVVPQDDQNPETIIIGQEQMVDIKEQIYQLLSPFETQVLERYLGGEHYIRIAKELDKSPKSVDNAIQRIRGKVRAHMAKIRKEEGND